MIPRTLFLRLEFLVISSISVSSLPEVIKLGKKFYFLSGSCRSLTNLTNDISNHLDTLLYANKVEKFAINFGIEMKQTRIIAITERAIYNINGKKLQREVELKDVFGVTKCLHKENNSKEFTIHVSKNYDIRYTSNE